MRLRLLALTVLAILVAGCGSSQPTDVSLLTRACKVRPGGSQYDWSYATVDGHGVVTGVALCGSDGSVSQWDPRPSGSGDHVVLYGWGQS